MIYMYVKSYDMIWYDMIWYDMICIMYTYIYIYLLVLNDLISPSEVMALNSWHQTHWGIKEVAEWAQQEADRGEVMSWGSFTCWRQFV